MRCITDTLHLPSPTPSLPFAPPIHFDFLSFHAARMWAQIVYRISVTKAARTGQQSKVACYDSNVESQIGFNLITCSHSTGGQHKCKPRSPKATEMRYEGPPRQSGIIIDGPSIRDSIAVSYKGHVFAKSSSFVLNQKSLFLKDRYLCTRSHTERYIQQKYVDTTSRGSHT